MTQLHDQVGVRNSTKPEEMMALSPDAPTVRYYRAMTGNWSGIYRFQITDRAAMRAAVPGRLDRLRLALLHRFAVSRMETTVAWSGDGEVRHSTRITSWGLPCLRSLEVFRLDVDGRSIVVEMVQHLPPALWWRREFPLGSGAVEDPAIGADYRLPWIGGEIEQRARVVAEGIELTQRSPWFHGEMLLRRVPLGRTPGTWMGAKGVCDGDR